MKENAPEKILALSAIILLCGFGIVSGLLLILLRPPQEKALWLRDLAQNHLERATVLPQGEEQTRHLQDAEKSLLLALEQTPFDSTLWQKTGELYARTGQDARAAEARKMAKRFSTPPDNNLQRAEPP